MSKWEGSVSDGGLVMMILGAIIIVLGLLSTCPHNTEEAHRLDSGIVAQVNNMSVLATNKPSAGIVKQVNVIVKDDGNNNLTIIEQSDIDLLARLMTAEQGYDADEMDYYLTGSVVINRMKSNKYPDTLQDVIYQDGQYQCVENLHINRPYDEVAYQVAEELLVYGTNVDEQVVYQSEFKQGSGIYDKRGNTYYCYR